MNKMKYRLIHRIYDDVSLTSDELNMILWLSKNADDSGTVRGVYYRAYAKELSICNSQFYNLLKSLKEKGYIFCEKEYKDDIDITLLDNCFLTSGEDDEPLPDYRDYLNLNMEIFSDMDFYSKRVYAKKLILAIIVKTINDKARRKKFYRKTYSKTFYVPANEFKVYKDKLHVSMRMIKKYFKEIEKWVSSYNDSVYTEKDILSIREKDLSRPYVYLSSRHGMEHKQKPDRFDSDVTYIKMLCRRGNIDYDNVSIDDAAILITQYNNRATALKKNIRSIFEKALGAIGNILNAAGLNKYISNYLANNSNTIFPMA